MNQSVMHQYQNLSGLPKDESGPVFKEPWQAQAFAVAVSLCEQGYFSWSEWVEQFSAQVKLAQQSGDPDLGDTYYNHWLKSLEVIVSEKQIIAISELKARKEAWREAYLRTPHGKSVEL